MALSETFRGSRGLLGAISIAVAALLRSAPALADARPELRSRLVYSAPSTCPDEGRFLALLAQHSVVVIDGAAPITLHVEVTRDQGRHRGRVALVASEEEGVREVVANRCEDVVRGLALFSAIALDAYLEGHRREEPPTPEPPPSAPPNTTGSLPAREAPARARAPVLVIAPVHPAPWLTFGFGLGLQGATASRFLGRVGVFGELELSRTLGTSLRMSANGGAAVPQSYRDGTLSFAMGWLRLDGCPGWVLLAQTLRASVCPALDVGLQRAGLEGTAGGRTETRPWLAAGGVARLRSRLGPTVALETSVGAFAPLLPFDFRTRSGIAYATPAVVPVVEVDLVVPLF